MTFTSKIRQLREQARLSQQDVADTIGVARATYASLEADRRPPNLDEINALAKYYEISPAELISGDVSMANEPAVEYKRAPQNEPDIEPREIDPQVTDGELRRLETWIHPEVEALHELRPADDRVGGIWLE